MGTIIDFLSDHGIPYWVSGKNTQRGWVNIRCFLCGDRSSHLGINLSSGLFHCWKCGEKGHVARIIQFFENCSTPRAKAIAGQLIFAEGDSGHQPIRPDVNADIVKGLGFSNELKPKHRTYLEERRFDPDMIQRKYRIMSAGHIGKYKHRIIIPIIMDGRIVSFTARATSSKSHPKYINLPDDKSIVPSGQQVYGIDYVGSTALIVEGATDCWRLGHGAIATLGTAWSMGQAYAICRKDIKRVGVMFDFNEPEAQKKANDLAICIASICARTEVVEVDFSGDPADMSEDDVRHLRRFFF